MRVEISTTGRDTEYMQSIKDIPQGQLSGTALVRIDLNTEDDWRMEAALPTLRYLQGVAEKILVISHKGRPQRGDETRLSLASKANVLAEQLGEEVTFFPGFDWESIRQNIAEAPKGSVCILENIRFLPGELTNSTELAEQIASLGDYFVNEAFAVSHRANASVAAVAKQLPSYAGIELMQEVDALSGIMEGADRPLVLILGGAKARDKLGMLQFFRDKADAFLLGGAAANTLLHLQGVDVGDSLIDESEEHYPILRESLEWPQLMLPVDWKEKGTAILDIGDKTTHEYAKVIAGAKTIVWNGPLGLTEEPGFRAGTQAIAEAISANKDAYSLVGGGETVTFVEEEGMRDVFSFVSTGGGAMLDFLAGKKLPGLEALETNRN